ncbi:MAG: stage III sporulation protein AF [Bacteroides sp.]|nr:stage III sporulation protein AF [Bacillota bacterium]MCM1394290.1 stage III sporulation protein AF [[Eubacterium] siraeum]MCM1456014.1 stage III sporulation protein AF [Bacteroides sp.]
MSAWIMSIVGVICLGVLLEIVLPEGQTAKYVKGAFSLLVVFVIAAPLPALFKKDYKFSIDSSAFEVNEEYIASTYAFYTEGFCQRAVYALKSNGYDAEVEIELSEDAPVKIRLISVTVFNFKQEVEKRVEADVKGILKETLKCDESTVKVTLENSA